jgi:cytoskeletal protein CcmA (bactofilin family)
MRLRHAAARLLLFLALAPTLGPAAAPAARAEDGATVRRGSFAEDLFVAGLWVDVAAEVAGDLFAAGAWADVVATVTGDAVVAGGMIDVEGAVRDNLVAAGVIVTVAADVEGKVMAAGGRLRLARRATVHGTALLAGGSVEISGQVEGDVAVTAGRTVVSGRIGGDLQVIGGPVELTAGARVDGDVTAYGPQAPFVAEGAEVGGAVSHVTEPAAPERPEVAAEDEPRFPGVVAALLLLGLVGLGVAVHLLLPGYAVAAGRRLRAHPWQSVGLGLALLTATPVAIVALAVTLIGLPLALAALPAYVALLLLGWVVAGFGLGGAVAGLRFLPAAVRDPRARPYLYAAAVLLLGLAALLLPVVGRFLALVALLLGMGAAAAQAYRAWLGEPAGPAAAGEASDGSSGR